MPVAKKSMGSSPSLVRNRTRSSGGIDLAHYDSDKTYAGQRWALSKMWPALRPGGVLIMDDIQYQTAFRDFAATVGPSPIVVQGEGKLIGVIAKPSES